MKSAACKRDPNEVEALLRQRDLGESVCPADGLRPGQHGWSAARIPPGIKGVNVVQEKAPVGGVPEPGGLPAASSAAMTHDQRNQLRHLIDQAKRRQLANHKPPPGRNQEARRATYRAYYQRNRDRILARRAASRAA